MNDRKRRNSMIHTDELYRRIYENAEKEYTEYITALKERNI
jgi:hypothetical protein